LVNIIHGESVDELLNRLTRKPDPVDQDGVTTIWVTELTNCLYWSYLERTGARPDTGRMVFLDYVRNLGKHLHHAFEARLAGETEKPVVVEIEPGVVVRGRADLYWRDQVIEFKTYTARREIYENLHHLAQISFYIKHLGARKGILIYMSRVKPEYYMVELDMGSENDRELVEKANEILLERAKRYARWLRGLEEPRPEPGPWCRFCPFWRICRAGIGYNNPFEPLKTYIQPSLTRYLAEGRN
jgi:CRISPR/Cas system-associated exonuclease Cas4 (RecB family)